MFLSECTGTSGTIFECRPSLVWIISISRFGGRTIVRGAAPGKSIAGTFARPANISFYGD
jgi:hypothetical protein